MASARPTHLPLFVEFSDGVLQALLLLLGEDVGELITRLQEGVENPLVQLAEKLLTWRGTAWLSVWAEGGQQPTPRREGVTPLNKPLSHSNPPANHCFFF